MPVHISLVFAKLAVLAAGTRFDASEPRDAPLQSGRLPVLDGERFARLRATMPDAGFCYFLYCHLLDVEFHLEEIARARAAGDLPRLSHKAQVLAGMTADAGAMRASAAARRLGAACRPGNYPEIFRLIGELSQCCTECELELRRFLAYRAQAAGAA
jgi:hypothetical protein